MKNMFEKIWKATCLSGLAVLWVLTFLYPTFADAFTANDMGDGILELSTRTDEGFVVRSIARLQSEKDKKKMVYFCVSEAKGYSQRCFYGLEREFRSVNEGDKMLGLQYELSDRFYNNKKQIPIGDGRYFYSLKVIRPSA